MSANPKIEAPFSKRTVDLLRKYQESGEFHPYTCKDPRHTEPLAVTQTALFCREKGCSYMQGWVHMFLGEEDEQLPGED